MALDLAGGCRPAAGSRLRLVGVHGPHEEEVFLDLLGDVSEVVRSAHRRSAVVALGGAEARRVPPRSACGPRPECGGWSMCRRLRPRKGQGALTTRRAEQPR